jgi:lysophospholipase L1-like esterase
MRQAVSESREAVVGARSAEPSQPVRVTAAGIARKLAISVLSLVAVLLLAELLARAGEPGPMSLFDSNPYDRPEETLLLPDGSTRTVQVTRHKPGFRGRWDGTWYEINSRGWRGGEFQPTFAPEELRVLAVGDSCTFGKGVIEQDCWPRQLERLLQERHPERRVMVANLGVNGYSSLQYQRVIEQAFDTKPHLVVLGYNVNDFPNITARVDKVIYQNEKTLRAHIPGKVREQLSSMALYRLLRSAFYELKETRDLERMERISNDATQGFGRNTERWRTESKVLGAIAETVRGAGAQMAIFLFPFENMVYLDEYTHGPVDSVRGLCEEIGVPFVDMVGEFREHAHRESPPRELFLTGDRYHPNPEGYSVVARAVVSALEAQGWLETTE